MADVRLDLRQVPEAACPARIWAWKIVGTITGLRTAVVTDGEPKDDGAVLVVHGPRDVHPDIPYDPAYEVADPFPRFPTATVPTGSRLNEDWIGAATFLLTQREERARHSGDPRDALHVDACANPDIYRFPYVSAFISWLADRVDASLRKQGRRTLRIMPWPEGEAALVVSSDADEIRWSWRRRALHLATKPWRLAQGNAYWNIPALAARLERSGMRGTFFVGFGHGDPGDIQYQADELRDELSDLLARGHEVGLHGSLRSAADPEIMRQERHRLQAVLGVPPISVRQHYLRFAPDLTWPAQEHAGFEVDSTAQVRGLNGFKHGLCHPFALQTEDLVEVPLVAMDSYLLSGGRSPDDALLELRGLWDTIRPLGGAFVLNWHNEWYNPRDHPRFVEVLDRFLAEVDPDAGIWRPTIGQAATHWRQRWATRVEPDEDRVLASAPSGTAMAFEGLGAWDIDSVQVVAESAAADSTARGRPRIQLPTGGLVELRTG